MPEIRISDIKSSLLKAIAEELERLEARATGRLANTDLYSKNTPGDTYSKNTQRAFQVEAVNPEAGELGR